MSFHERIRQLGLIVEAMELNVLVWGSGRSLPEHLAKREQLRQAIRDRFPNADVRFSEELTDEVPGAANLTFAEQELWHLAACDICVVLDTSEGPGEEIAHFVRSAFAHKLLILTPEENKNASGFPASLRENQNQWFFSDEEFDSGALFERVFAHLRQIALGKMEGLF
jgi:hypothetical protein